MKILSNFSLAACLITSCTISAMAGVNVSSPSNGTEVKSPFTLSANAATCSSQTVGAMGYSLDSSTDTTIVNDTSVEAQVQAATGAHILHVKAWGNGGASCVTDVAITIANNPSVIPAWATSVSSLQALDAWTGVYDSVTGGSSIGRMTLVNSPSRSGNTRKFVTSYTNGGGERYFISFGDDTVAKNFLYDVWINIASPSNSIGNLEMDMNQVISNGQTVIFGIQCDGYSGTWDYTVNAGTPQRPSDQWIHSKAACNPRSWSTNIWHHVQISYSRDDSGMVTYHYVSLDGVQSNLNATVPSSFALGWGPALLTNFQVDGLGLKGTSTVYLDDLTVYRW